MLEQLRRNWWLVALRGVAGLLFGIAAFAWPGIGLLVLVTLFGAYALVDGVLAIGSAVRHRRASRRWWVTLLEGIVGVVAGLVAWFLPGLTAVALVFVVAAWALVTGALAIAAAIRLRKEIHGEWVLALSGALSILLGVLLFLRPQAGALALLWLIAAYAVVSGALLLAFSFWLRGLGREAPPHGLPA